jgi:uncharacterized protein
MVGNIKIPVVIISDGKPGHENQSLGIAEHLPNPDILLLKHNLKEGFSEGLLRLQVRFLDGAKRNPDKLLRKVFSESDVEKLKSHNPKAIIAAGTLSAGPCLVAGYLTGAITCVCMKPSFLPLDMFDLAVVPAHDNPPDKPNILVTLAAPNRVSPKRLESESEIWAGELPDNSNKIISWIVGGPSSSAGFDENHVLKGLESTLEWAEKYGWQVWLSTARRTPLGLENAIENLAIKHRAFSWYLLWHKDKRNPLYAMFHRSRVAVVTSDSVSMIAEAASAGKGPLVYQATENGGRKKSKQDRMVDGLLEAGYGLRAGDADKLNSILDGMNSKEVDFPRLDDTQKAADRLLGLVI